jgi:hypothetical protein
MLQHIKIQVWTRIAGSWDGPHDWTRESHKQFCLDKKDERLEEMLIIVSNSEANHGSEQPFKISKNYPLQVSVSNVGCYQWEGSASQELTGYDGSVQQAAAGAVRFEVKTNLPGRMYFESVAGNVTGSQLTPFGPECKITVTTMPGYITKKEMPDGRLDYNLDLDMADGNPPDRNLVSHVGITMLSTTTKFECPDFNQTATADQYWAWMSHSPSTNFTVSADGQVIEGRVTDTSPVGSQTITFRFTSKRQE